MTTFEEELNSAQHVNKGVHMQDLGLHPIKKYYKGHDKDGQLVDQITGERVHPNGSPIDPKAPMSDDVLNELIDEHNSIMEDKEVIKYAPFWEHDPQYDINSYTTAYRRNSYDPIYSEISYAQGRANDGEDTDRIKITHPGIDTARNNNTLHPLTAEETQRLWGPNMAKGGYFKIPKKRVKTDDPIYTNPLNTYDFMI